ncbi:IS3 family transposase [Streptomyces sp. NBC_01296]|uniref:IS3 family transposase n=1 Tax=Streptomyces sp. NBC_01296 TaxID=2903816 RepID=UPI003FA3C761
MRGHQRTPFTHCQRLAPITVDGPGSQGRRTGEPLPVHWGSPAPVRREAALRHPWDCPLELLRRRSPAARTAAEAGLVARIRKVQRESCRSPDGTYCAPRITAELRNEGERINHKRVARIMRTIGLGGRPYASAASPTCPSAAGTIWPRLCRDSRTLTFKLAGG